MAGYEKSKGVFAIATEYNTSTKQYTYTKFDAYIAADSYTASPDQRQDLDSFVNSNGKLKRHVLPHTRTKVELSTPFMKTEKKNKCMDILNKAMRLNDGKCNVKEQNVRIRFLNDRTNDYSYADVYIQSTISFPYYGIIDGEPMYQSVRFAFIEY